MENQIRQYLSQLLENPGDLLAMQGLEGLIGQDKDRWLEMVLALSEAAEAVDEPGRRARLLMLSGEVAGLWLGDHEEAEGYLAQALAVGQGGGVEQEAQVLRLSLKGDWRSVIEVYQSKLTGASEEAEQVDLLCRMGFVFRNRLSDPKNAMKAFQSAFKMDRGCLVALQAARDIYAEVGNWKLVAQLIQFEIQAFQARGDREGSASAYVRLGDVLREHLEQVELARTCYDNALKLEDGNAAASRGLAMLNGEPVEEPSEDVEVSMDDEDEEAAEADASASSDEADAVDDGDVVDDSGSVEDVVAVAEGDDVDVDVDVDVADADEDEVSVESADEDVVEAEAVEIDGDESDEVIIDDEAPSQDGESMNAVDAGEASEEGGEPVAAEGEGVDSESGVEAELSADEVDGEAVASAEEVEAIEVDDDEGDEVVEVDDEAIEVDESELSADEVEGEAVASAEEVEDEAIEVEDGAVEEDIVEDAAVEVDAAAGGVEGAQESAPEASVEEEEEGDEAVAPWQDRAAAMAASGGVAGLQGALSLHAEHAAAEGELLGLLERALGSAPDDEGHYEALRGRIKDGAVWSAISGVFERHPGGASGRQVGRIKLYEQGDYEAARSHADALGAEAGGFEHEVRDAKTASGGSWRRLQQELTSEHEGLEKGARAQAVYGRIAELARAFDQQERRLDALRHWNQESPEDREPREALKAIYGAEEKWQNYVEVLKQEVTLASGPEEQAPILWEMVEIYRDRLSLDVMVINTFNQILDLEPGNIRVLDQLAEQYEKMRRFPDLIGVLQKRAEVARTTKKSIEVHLQIANLFLEKFNNQAEAIKSFEQVLEYDPHHPEAIDFLKQMYDRRREYEKLVDIHEREIERLPDDQKGARYKEVAELATQKIRRPGRATELWARVLEFSPKDLEALEALEGLYEREKDWDNLVDIGERKYDLIEDDQEKIKLAEKLGRLYGDRMERPQDAARCWRRVLSVDATNRRAQDSLKRLLIDAQDWDGLGEFFESTDDDSGHVRTLETLAGTIKEDEVKIELLFRSARIWRERVGDTSRAVRALEKIKGIDEGNARVAGMLAPIYEEAGDHRKLALSLEVVLGALDPGESSAESLEVLRKLARLNEEQLRHPEVAFMYFARAFALAPIEVGEPEVGDEAEGGSFADLERVAEGIGAWEDLVGVYSDKLDAIDAGAQLEEARELRLRTGRIYNSELGQVDEALSCYAAVLAVFPDEVRALSAQEEIYQKTGDWVRLMEVFDKKLSLTADPSARVSILLSKAVIHDEYNESPHDAVDCYLQVLDQDPGHAGALGSLHRLYEGLEDYESLAGIIRQEIGLAEASPLSGVKGVDGHPMSHEEAVEAGVLADGAGLDGLILLKLQLGLVSAQSDSEGRVEAVLAFADVLAVQPDNEDALMALEALSEDPEMAQRVADTLEPLYAEAGLWERLVGAREVQLEGLAEYEARVAKLLSIGEVLVEQLSDLERGFGAYGRALRESPTSEEARERLELIADAGGDWVGFVGLMEDIIPGLTDPALTHWYQTRVSQVIESQLDDGARAQDAWRRVLDLEPEDEQALSHLEALTMEGQQWHELDEVYGRMLSIQRGRAEDETSEGGETSGETRAAIRGLLFKQATLHEEMLEDASGAIEIYQAVLDDEPRNLRACRAMDRLLGGEGRYDELAGNLEQQLGLVQDPEEARELKCRLAGIQETYLYQVPSAIGLYGEVLAEDPGHEEALESLERLIEAEPDHQMAIVDILEPLYRAGGRWSKLIEALEIRLRSLEDRSERVALLHQIAGLNEEEVGDLVQAFSTMRRALAEDVGDEASMGGLYRLAEQIDAWEALIDALEEEVARSMDVEVSGALDMRIAALQESRLGDVDGATAHYCRVLESQPEHLEAIDHLERIYKATAQWQHLVDVLQRKVPLSEGEDAQKLLLLQAATIYEDMLGLSEASTEVYEQVLTIDEADETAIEQLDRLYGEAERWHDLIDLCQRKLSLAGEGGERRALLFRIAGLHEEELGDAHKAIDTYRAVLEVDGGDAEALERLDGLYEQTEQWSYQLETLERRLSLVDDPAQGLALRHRIGALWEQSLGDALRAVEVYKGILADAPDFVATIEALEGMVERREEEVAAAEVLRPLYFDGGQWDRLIDLFEVQVGALVEDPTGQAELLKEIGQTQELRLGDGAAAFAAYGRAVSLRPDDEGVHETLERLASELGCWGALVELLEDRLGEVHDMDVARRVALRIGRILEEEVLDRGRAIERFQMVLDLDPTDQVAVKSLDRLYGQEGRFEELAHILQEEILQEEDEAARTALRFRLGNLYETALEDIAQAIGTYSEILLGDPEHDGARESLERMFGGGFAPMEIGSILGPWYEERGYWAQLIDVYVVQLEGKEDPDDRFAMLHQIAELYRDRLGDAESAFTVLGSAIGERPGDEATIELLEQFADALDGWQPLAGFFTEALERCVNAEDQRQLLLKIAQIMDLRLGEVEAAEQAYRQVLSMDDSDQGSLEALDRIYNQQARWLELAEVIQREIELSLDEDRVVSLSYRLGTLFEHQLGDLDRAVQTYNNLLDVQPTHSEALMALEGIYQMREEWEPLFSIYERQADLLDADHEGQAEVYAKMASLADNMLMRPLDAIDLWSRVLDLRSEDVTALRSLAALYEREEQHGDLVQVLEREVRVTADPDRQVQLWLAIGDIWRGHLFNDDRALEAFRQVLMLDPINVGALYACRELYQRLGDYEALVQVIDQLIIEETLSREEQLELYVQLGEIQGSLLRNIDDAIKAWTAVLALDPGHRLALDSLEELYSEQGQWEPCVDILGRKVEALEVQFQAKYGDRLEAEEEEEVIEDPLLDEQIELHLRIADIWESKVGQREQAVLAYEAVLNLDQGHMQASRALEGLYGDQGAWDKLVELYLVRQEYVEDTFEGLEILRNASRIYEEQLSNPEAAFLVLCRAFMESYEDEQTAFELERLARSTQNWETLVTLYNNVLEGMGDGPDSMSLHVKVARWWADELGDRDKAIDHYQRALELGPDNTEVMSALEVIYEKAGRWQELVGIMALRAELTPEDDIRVELFRRIGDVQDLQMNDAERALEAYRTILRIDPTDVFALGSLEGIYERTQSWPELIEVLERKAEAIFEQDQVVEIKHRVAQLWEVEVGSIERAVEAYRAVLSIEPTHLPSLGALERLYRHLEKWFELQEVYFMQLSLAQEASAQVAIYARSAQVYEVEIGDVESAVETYGKVLLVEPHDLHAITELERLFSDLQRWDDLYQTLERHVEASADRATRVELFHSMGQVCREHMGDIHRAIEAYRRVLELDAFNVEALYELAGLYELASDWEACLAVYESLSEVVTEPEAGVEIHYRMGRIKEENLVDQEGAEQRYRFSLEIDPSYKPAIDALKGMYERREDWPGVISMLKQEEEFTRDLEQKAALLSQIGQIYEHRLGDEIRALDYYEQTIDLAPENVEAAEPLSRMYLREKRWARAWPLLDLLVRHHGHDHGREDLYLLHYNLGLCCEELGQEDRALKEYGEAYEFAPNFLPTLMGMGRLMFKRGDLDRAFKIYRTIARHHADTLSEAELTEIHHQCGDIKRRLGDGAGAMEMFDEALKSTPDYGPSLQAMVELTTEGGHWSHAVAWRQRQLALLTDDLERYDALATIGDLLAQQLGNVAGAVEVYRKALEVQPESVSVLRKLLDIYTQAQMWTDAVAVLGRIAELEQDPGRRSKYCYTIAVIFRDEVGDMMRSVEFFNRALDNDVTMLKSFEAIDRVLTHEHAWKELERSYRKMLHRVKDLPSSPEMDGLKLLLWKNLGEIYRSRQGNPEAAIEAYKIAVVLRPDNHEIHEILADLYESSGNHPEEAISEHKRLIAMKPFRIESYRALFNAFMKTQRYDEAWCMSSALTFLNSASAKEQEFYQNYLGAGPATPNRPLSPDHWKMLYHEEQDMLISNIMALISVYMRGNYYAFEHKVWDIHKRKDLMQPNPQLPFWRIYQWTAQTLSVNPAPNVYLKRDQMAPMLNGNLDPPAFIVGNALFQNAQDREVAFIVGKELAMARPEHYLGAGFFPTENLKVLFMAAMQLTNPALNLGAGNAEFNDVVARMQRMPPPVLIQLRKFMQQYLNTGQNPNLSAWLKAIDHTSNRIGLLMCGDLLQAANSLKNEQVPISKLTVKEKIKELVLFSISDQYFQLRKDLGLALRAG